MPGHTPKEKAKKRQDTKAGRAKKRQDAGRTTTGRKRPTLPAKASPKARTAVAKTRSPGGFGPGNIRLPVVRTRKRPRRR